MVKHYKPNLVYVLKVDGKYYVGCHTRSVKFLREREIIFGSGNPVSSLHKQHKITIEDVYRRIELIKVYECDSKEEALDLEVKMIKEYKDKYEDDCLNIKMDGNKYYDQPYGIPRSNKTKEKISKSKKGIKLSEASKQRMSESAKGQVAWNKGIKTNQIPWNKGKSISSETIEKIRSTCKQNHKDNSKRILNTKTGEIYSSTKECCEKNNLCFSQFKHNVEKGYARYRDFKYL